MPIYEFECRACHRKTSALVLTRARLAEVRCRHCGGADLERLWSRFAAPRSEESRLDALADPSSLAGLDESDPQSVARFMKKMGRELGEDVGEDLDQAIDESLAEETSSKSEPGQEGEAGSSAGPGSEDL
jgi:putative FmdB family regulatory protein